MRAKALLVATKRGGVSIKLIDNNYIIAYPKIGEVAQLAKLITPLSFVPPQKGTGGVSCFLITGYIFPARTAVAAQNTPPELL